MAFIFFRKKAKDNCRPYWNVLEYEFRNIYKDSARYWEKRDIEFDCVRFADESLKKIIISEIKWHVLDRGEKDKTISALRNKYNCSKLFNKYGEAQFEILSWDDVVKLLI